MQQARALLQRLKAIDFPLEQPMRVSLAHPETCAYYQVAAFYHGVSIPIREKSPALFELLEGFCLASYRRASIELDRYTKFIQNILTTGENNSGFSRDELQTQMGHYGNLAMTSEMMEGFCRNFPNYTSQMQVFINHGTADESLNRTALLVLTDFIAAFEGLQKLQKDLSYLIKQVLCGPDGRPVQAPAAALVALEERKDPTYARYQRMEDDVRIQTNRRTAVGNKKGGISAATFYASDNLPALIFLEFVQMCTQNLPVARCASCGGLFVPFSSRAKYCERMLDAQTGATCKEVAAKRLYAEEVKANKAKELYNKLRNKYQMRCSRAPENAKMRQEYEAWKKQAQMLLTKYELGEIDFEELEKLITPA